MNRPVKILLVEDSADDAELALHALRRGGFEPAFRRVQTADGVQAALAAEPWDAVISDYSMPGFTGVDALRIFRSTGLDIPFILTSGAIGEETAVEAMKSGASDYIMKSALARLAPVLERELREAQMRAAHRQAQDEQAKHAEELRRFRAAMDISGDGIVLVDRASLRYIDVNQTLCDMVGRTRQEILEMTPIELFTADRETLEREYDALIADNNSVANKREGEYRARDGSLISIETRRRALRTGEGWIIVATVRDITERLQATRELRESERQLRDSGMRFRAIFEQAPIAMALLDKQGHALISNSYLSQMLGYGSDELAKMKFSEFTYPADVDADSKQFNALLEGKIPAYKMEKRYVHKDGNLIWANLFVTILRDENGLPQDIIGMAEDITERKQAAQDLRESERRFSDMLQNVELVSVMLDRDGRIAYCNDYLLRVTGWRYEELIGRDWAEVFKPSSDGGDWKKGFFATLLGNLPEALHGENDILTRAGERRLIRWNNSVLRSGAGAVIGTASLGEDITERKQAEERIAHLNRVYATLSGINALIVRVRDRDELFRDACRIAVEQGGFPMAWIGMVDRAAMNIVPVASAGMDQGLFAGLTKLFASGPAASLGDTAAARAIREKKAVVFNELQSSPSVVLREEHAKHGISSLAVLPLIVGNEAVGVVALYASKLEFIDDEGMRVLAELVGNIAFAIDNIGKEAIRREAEIRIVQLNRVHAMLSGINSLIVHVGDREELLSQACRIATEAGGFRMAWIGMVEPRTVEIGVVASAGMDADLLTDLKTRFSASQEKLPGNTMAERALREKTANVANELHDNPRVLLGARYAELGVFSMALLPLIVSDAAVGVLALYANQAEFFHQDEMKLLNGLAGDIGFALENIGREEKIARLSRIQALMSGINALIVRAGDRDELFRDACRIAVEAGGFRMAWIGAVDTAAMKIVPVASAGAEAEFLTLIQDRFSLREDAPMGNTMSARAAREKKAMVSNQIRDDTKVLFARERTERGIASMAILPLLVADEAVGVLALYSGEAGFFDDDELKLLTELAGDIAFAIDHIGKEDRIARLSRLQALMSGINALIVRVADRDELFRGACQIATLHGRFRMAWIGMVNRDSGQIDPVASAGEIGDFFEVAPLAVMQNDPEGRGLAGRVVREKKAMLSNDVRNDPQRLMKKEMEERGINSLAIIPLIVGDEVAGVLALYAADVGFFDAEQMRLLRELGGNISFAMDHIENQKRLDYLAYYDSLTGLANRSLFLERVGQYMRSAASAGHKLALFVIDLERFRNINDTLGRPAGDALLRQVAEWLTPNVGDASLVARVGADHFAVVLPEVVPGRDLGRLLEKTVDAFIEHSFHLDDTVFRIAAKVGAALFPEDGANADTLFRNAEAALKKAKASGERHLFYNQQMTEAVAGKLTLENQLRHALDNGEFVLYYQPKVNLASGKITGAEALIRWNDPRTGLVPPGRFIPILEETGLIYEVGRWALRQSIDQDLRWRGAGLRAPRTAVNVSPLQLRHRNFVAELEKILGIDPRAAAGLELEITESLIMEDVTRNIANLKAIREMGVSIALDDFGTGYSSLSLLGNLPVDTLKIDRSFIIDMTAGAKGLALVQTIIGLAHSLGLKVVAEGVETEEQSHLLRLLRCDEMQGYLFSKPVPAEIFEAKFLGAALTG